MTSEQLVESLRKIDPQQEAEFDSLAMAVRNQSRELTRTLVRVWSGSDPVMSRKAERLLAQSEELTLGPLSESRDSVGAVERVWRLRSLIEGELQLRERLLSRLDPLLEDRSPVPMPAPPGDAEEPVLPRRVCDEAYLLVRRMLNPQEGPLTFQLNSRAFLGMSDKDKNAEIEKARTSRKWSQFIEPIDE